MQFNIFSFVKKDFCIWKKHQYQLNKNFEEFNEHLNFGIRLYDFSENC